MKNVLTAFARNTVFANIVLVLIFLAGGMALFSMIRENFPEFSLDMITITVPYPGADPEEVEEGISQKIEEAIEGLEGIKQVTTKSNENSGSVNIEVKQNYEVNEVLDRVRSQVDAISNFPVDAEKPIISELLLNDPVLLLYLAGDMSERRLKEWAEIVKDELQQIDVISKVEIFGARNYEIGIEVSEQRLREYRLTFNMVTEAVRRSNLNLAGGTIRTQGEEIRVRTVGRKYTGEELAQIVVMAKPTGEVITLDRLATINDGFSEDPFAATINGEPALIIIIYKSQEDDALTISHAVNRYVSQKVQQIPQGATIRTLYDNTEMLRDRIKLLVRNGIIGLSLVFILLWIFLDIRLSFWAGMGIPISITGALAILWFIGGSINMISLFGLIMVLGIIVDDAIVVGEAIYVHRQNGAPPLQAAVDGTCEVGIPVIAAVVTTIVAFIPLALVGGIMGKFIRILPMVVIACLIVSLIECLILLPAHLSHLPDPNRVNHSGSRLRRMLSNMHRLTSRGLEWCIDHLYKPFLSKVLYWRYISFCTAIAVLLITIGLVKGGIIKFQVFPEIDGFVATATVEFPNGTPVELTRQAVEEVEGALLRLNDRLPTLSGEPLVQSRLTLIGQTLQEMPQSGTNYGSVQAILLTSEQRGMHSKDVMVEWEKEVGVLPGVKSLVFEGMAMGPPGAPIEIWIQGTNMDDILNASDDLKTRLGQFEGVYQIRSDFLPGKNEMRFELKPEARTLGLTVDDLAKQIYAGYYGEEAVRLQRGRDDIRVKVRYTAGERRQLAEMDRIRIRTQTGHEVPLLSVANVYFSSGYSTITRTDGRRRVAVSADVDSKKANANEVFNELSSHYFPQLTDRYPGITVALQGEKKKMRESLSSLYVGFPLAILGIFIIIATIFRSYAQPFVIMFTVPFGIIGAIWGHLLLGFDLTIMSMFGIVALTGVVVNDAIVFIERINENLAEGMRFFDAILHGGARRFRAIFLTTISTVGGLTPLIMETDFQARFLIPMALSIAAGVAFATVLTLLLIPSLLAILNDFRLLTNKWRHGRWLRREAVEPASYRHLDPDGKPSEIKVLPQSN
jgi:multidrug efflux pump subunit AcrB